MDKSVGMERYSSLVAIYGPAHFERIWNSKVLVVGAGGIGCEILKNLALSGFQYVEVIDLDSIDVSNLNRQFLFRPEHVGKSKAEIAAAAVKKFNDQVNIIPHFGNIKDSQFGTSYFGKFDVILNALDNVDARKHVNRLSLAANVPLIDAGTTGYLGQVMPIFKGITACYECKPKPAQKVYPICTIRSTPDKPVHCVVWAKECFKLLFGNATESMLFEDPDSGDTSTYMHLLPLPKSTSSSALLLRGRDLLIALFSTEIAKRVAMDVYKTAKCTPRATSLDDIDNAGNTASKVIEGDVVNPIRRPSQQQGWDRALWTDEECGVELLLCIHDVVTRSPDSIGTMSFDKDDALGMRFVCAASNMRSRIFGIPPLCYHDVKGIAGNIIPAIATTNAIVAGLQVLQAIKILKPGLTQEQRAALCSHTYCQRMPTRKGLFLQPTKAEGPEASCYVCNTAQLTLQVDISETTLEVLVKKVLKGRLGFNEPSIMLGDSILYEEGEGADEELAENLVLPLARCPGGGIHDGSILTVEDFTQNLTVNVVVKHIASAELEASDEENVAADMFVLGGQSLKRKPVAAEEDGDHGTVASTDGDATPSAKRARTEGGEGRGDDADDVCIMGSFFNGDVVSVADVDVAVQGKQP